MRNYESIFLKNRAIPPGRRPYDQWLYAAVSLIVGGISLIDDVDRFIMALRNPFFGGGCGRVTSGRNRDAHCDSPIWIR